MRRDVQSDGRYDLLEPLLIDVMFDHYEQGLPSETARTLARQHATVFRHLLNDRRDQALAARSELLSRWSGAGVSPGTICAAEAKSFLEIIRFHRGHFRSSPRVLDAHLVFLRQAISLVRAPEESRAAAFAA